MPSPKFIRIFRRTVFLVGIAVAGVFLLELAAIATSLLPRNAAAAKPTATPAATPARRLFASSLTINGVRVTLAYVGHETAFRKNAAGDSLPMRCLEIGYVEESLHSEPIHEWNASDPRVVVNGTADEGVSRYTMTEPPDTFSSGPAPVHVSDPSHATAERIWLENDTLPSGSTADITLILGPNDQHETFVFHDVPIP